MRDMPWTPGCSMVAWIQAPLPLTSGRDKVKLLNFMRPQFSHVGKMWQSSCLSGCAARHLLSTSAHTSGSAGSVTICSERQSSNPSSTRKGLYCQPLPSPSPHCWILTGAVLLTHTSRLLQSLLLLDPSFPGPGAPKFLTWQGYSRHLQAVGLPQPTGAAPQDSGL